MVLFINAFITRLLTTPKLRLVLRLYLLNSLVSPHSVLTSHTQSKQTNKITLHLQGKSFHYTQLFTSTSSFSFFLSHQHTHTPLLIPDQFSKSSLCVYFLTHTQRKRENKVTSTQSKVSIVLNSFLPPLRSSCLPHQHIHLHFYLSFLLPLTLLINLLHKYISYYHINVRREDSLHHIRLFIISHFLQTSSCLSA